MYALLELLGGTISLPMSIHASKEMGLWSGSLPWLLSQWSTRGRDRRDYMPRSLELDETIEHLRASSLKVAQRQAGCKQVPCQDHQQRRSLLLYTLLYTSTGITKAQLREVERRDQFPLKAQTLLATTACTPLPNNWSYGRE